MYIGREGVNIGIHNCSKLFVSIQREVVLYETFWDTSINKVNLVVYFSVSVNSLCERKLDCSEKFSFFKTPVMLDEYVFVLIPSVGHEVASIFTVHSH